MRGAVLGFTPTKITILVATLTHRIDVDGLVTMDATSVTVGRLEATVGVLTPRTIGVGFGEVFHILRHQLPTTVLIGPDITVTLVLFGHGEEVLQHLRRDLILQVLLGVVARILLGELGHMGVVDRSAIGPVRLRSVGIDVGVEFVVVSATSCYPL